MPFDQKYTDDNFYRKGQFNVTFDIAPFDAVDEEAQTRALRAFLLALRDETKLKVSAFIDLEDVDIVEADVDEEPETVEAEFVIYNKLGVTSIGKMIRFMDEHLVGDMTPRIVLVDPQTKKKFKATNFTMRYLFNDFTAGDQKSNWEDLREHLKSDDKGYGALAQRKGKTMTPEQKIKLYNKKIREAKAELELSKQAGPADGEGYYVHTFYLTDTVTWVNARDEQEAIEAAWNGEGEVVDELHTIGLPEAERYLVEKAKPSKTGSPTYTPVHYLTGKAVELVVYPEKLGK